jgi:autotransporter-associated beta strand protein
LTIAETNSQTYAGVISGAGGLTKSGTGTMTLSASNTHTGGTTINAGTVAISNGSAFGSNTVTFGSNGTTVAALASVRVTNNYALTGNGTMDVGANVLTNSGVISGAGNLTKAGAGTMVLSGSNNFSGTTTVSAGVLALSNTNALSGSTLAYSSAGTISFLSLTGVNLGGLQGSTNLALTNASGTALALSVGGNSSNTTYSGALSGGGSLIKTGTGTLALSGNSSFTGATTISNGAVRVSSANGLGATNGGTTVIAGAALEVDGGITIGAEALSLNNNGISSGGSLRSISGANTYGGAISLGTGVAVGVDADANVLADLRCALNADPAGADPATRAAVMQAAERCGYPAQGRDQFPDRGVQGVGCWQASHRITMRISCDARMPRTFA